MKTPTIEEHSNSKTGDPTTAPTPTDRLYQIVQSGMCIGCGICESIAGRDVVQMKTVQNGYLRPVVFGDLEHETVDLIYDVCPGTRLETLPQRLIDDDTVIDPVWGPYKWMFSAHASDDSVRIKAASGGVLTALCKFLIDTKRVAFIQHATPSTEDPTFGDPHTSQTSQDVSVGSGSIYGPSAVLRNIRDVLDRGEEFAYVGKPCDISALRNYARYDSRIDRLVKYWLTPVCGGSVPPGQLDGFLESRGTDRSQLKWFKYRGDMCPGKTEFETRDGELFEAHMYEPYGGVAEESWQLPFRCKVCPDGPGEGADIAAGDEPVDGIELSHPDRSDTDKGSNATIVRTANGIELVNAAVEAGYLTIEHDITPRWYDECQFHHVTKKMFMRARWDGLRAEGMVSPRSHGLRLDEFASKNSPEENARQMEGTRQRLRNGKNTEERPVPRTTPDQRDN